MFGRWARVVAPRQAAQAACLIDAGVFGAVRSNVLVCSPSARARFRVGTDAVLERALAADEVQHKKL